MPAKNLPYSSTRSPFSVFGAGSKAESRQNLGKRVNKAEAGTNFFTFPSQGKYALTESNRVKRRRETENGITG